MQFSGNKYIHTVMQPPPSFCSTFSSFPLSPLPSFWKQLFYFCLWVWLFQVSNINRTIHYLSFCIWLIALSIMPSRFTHVEYMSEFHCFLRPHNSPLYAAYTSLFIPSSVDGRLGCFHLSLTLHKLWCTNPCSSACFQFLRAYT